MSEPARKRTEPVPVESDAEKRQRQAAAWAAYMAWADEGPGGPITAAEREAARRELDGPGE